jgi:hypothetical protein
MTGGDSIDFDAADLGGGRTLPPLIFATSRLALATRYSAEPVDRLLDALRTAGHQVVDSLDGTRPAREAAASVLDALGKGLANGVVLLGGYDVIPPDWIDCIPADMRLRVSSRVDPDDDFLVWSDDAYADTNNDTFAEHPVTRIPDGGDFRLLLRALRATNAPSSLEKAGIRNAYREFAQPIYARLPGTQAMERSEPYASHLAYPLVADRLYLMLHGRADDATRFWGETKSGGHLEAVNVNMVPTSAGSLVFSGACWGALIVEERARNYSPGLHLTPRTPSNSIALAFLAGGATAFVGSTGAHHSPLDKPYQYGSGVLHQDFWERSMAGDRPAVALFRAKEAFGNGLPHHRSRLSDVALELKVLRQFTCLGLGW